MMQVKFLPECRFDLKGIQNNLEGQQFKLNDVVLEILSIRQKEALKVILRIKTLKCGFLDLDITTENLLILDTKESEEISYYGTGFFERRC